METNGFDESQYQDIIASLISEERIKTKDAGSWQYSSSQTTATYCSVKSQRKLSIGQFDELDHVSEFDVGVLIIENIDLNWITKLGTRFRLSPFFFLDHAFNPSGPTPWEAIFGSWSADHAKPTQTRLDMPHRRHTGCSGGVGWHVYGVASIKEFQHTSHRQSALIDPNFLGRQLMYDNVHGWQAITCISYCRVAPHLYLFLVDAPIMPTSSDINNPRLVRAALKVPVSLNRTGLTIPKLSDQVFLSMSECLRRCLQHQWFLHALFANEKDKIARMTHISLSPSTIFYLIASSTWNTNIRILEETIQRISFEEIRQPSLRINDSLHDQRRELIHLHSQVDLTLHWIPDGVRTELDNIRDSLPAAKYIGYPDQALKSVVAKAESLEKLLMDTFNLLLSSVGLIEAEASKKQVLQQQRLTKLAFVYVPLSFVTGMFGMNIKEINGSPLPIWVCLVALAITGLCTAGAFICHDLWQKRINK